MCRYCYGDDVEMQIDQAVDAALTDAPARDSEPMTTESQTALSRVRNFASRLF